MKKAFLIFLLFLCYQIVAASLVYVVCRLTGQALESSATMQVYALAACGLVTTFCLVVFGLLRRRPPLRQGRLTPAKWSALVMVVLVSAWGLSLLLSPLDLPDGGSTAMFQSVASDPLALLVLVIIGPLLEEVFFRAGIARQLVLGGLSPHVAAVLTAAAFALVHGNVAQAVPAFVVGYLLTLCYFATGNIVLCALLHVVNNGLAVLVLLFPSLDRVFSGVDTTASLVFGTGLLVAGLAAALAVSLPLMHRRDVRELMEREG